MTTDLTPLILIAEDDADDRLLLRDAFLEINQTNTTFLNNGKLLLDHLQQLLLVKKLPKLILLDINMPVLDGRSVIKKLKNCDATKDIPLIVLSTSRNKDDIDSILALGATEFFSKPTAFSDLVAITSSIAHKWLTTKY